jgi:hypothetical protein
LFSASNSGREILEFSDVCRHYYGKWAEYIAVASSLLTLLGGMIVYWILMTNFLYNVVNFIYRKSMSISYIVSQDYFVTFIFRKSIVMFHLTVLPILVVVDTVSVTLPPFPHFQLGGEPHRP